MHSRWLRCLIVLFCIMGLLASVIVSLVGKGRSDLYRVTVLPRYRGYLFWPVAMNDHGQIVGYKFDGTEFTVLLWTRQSGLRELGITSDGSALAINNSGQIAGTMTDPNGNAMVFSWDPRAGLAQFNCRSMSNIMPILIGPEGQIVGTFTTNGGPRHAYVWDHAGRMRDLSSPNARMGWVLRSSESGQILGGFRDGNSGRSCLWDLADTNSPKWTPLPGQDDAYRDLNNGGYVLRAMLWHEDREQTWLFPLPGPNDYVLYVNDVNQVLYASLHRSVFTRWSPHRFPARWCEFLWDPAHGSISLDKALGLRSSEQLYIEDMNNEGVLWVSYGPDGYRSAQFSWSRPPENGKDSREEQRAAAPQTIRKPIFRCTGALVRTLGQKLGKPGCVLRQVAISSRIL